MIILSIITKSFYQLQCWIVLFTIMNMFYCMDCLHWTHTLLWSRAFLLQFLTKHTLFLSVKYVGQHCLHHAWALSEGWSASEVITFDWIQPCTYLSHCLASPNLDISSVNMFLKYIFRNLVLNFLIVIFFKWQILLNILIFAICQCSFTVTVQHYVVWMNVYIDGMCASI